MHTNYHFLKKYSQYLNQELSNAVLKQCFSQEKDEIVLIFLQNNNYKFLKISLKQDHAYILLLEDFARAKKNSVELWQELENQKIEKLTVFAFERSLHLKFENNYDFVIKFYGNRPNLLIYNNNELKYIFNNKLKADAESSIDGFNKNYERTLEAFQEAEEQAFKYLPTLGKLFNQVLEEKTFGISGLKKFEILESMVLEMDESNKYYIIEHADKVHLSLVEKGKVLEVLDSPQVAMQAYFRYYYSITIFLNAKKHKIQQLHKKISATRTYIFEKEKSLNKIVTGVSNEQIGNIIMANYHLIPIEAETVTLVNIYNNEPINITLKPKLSASKNAEWYYKKSKNEKININKLTENLSTARENLKRFQDQIDEIYAVENQRDLQNWIKKNEKIDKILETDLEHFKTYEFENYDIYVGKNAKNNDLLTLKYAKKDDYWFHAKDVSGSHVVVKKHNNQNLSKSVIEYAASLAAFYSKRKSDSLVPVIFTQKKYVRKTKGLPDGKVIVDKMEVVLVAPITL